MSNETFQIIISGAVVLALLALIVQVVAVFALLRTVRSVVAKMSPILARAKAILEVEPESIRRLEIVIDKTLRLADILARFAPRIGMLEVHADAAAIRATQLGMRAAQLGRSWELVETSAHFLSLELRPRLVSVTFETAALVESVGSQVHRVSRVFRQAIAHVTHLQEMKKKSF